MRSGGETGRRMRHGHTFSYMRAGTHTHRCMHSFTHMHFHALPHAGAITHADNHTNIDTHTNKCTYRHILAFSSSHTSLNHTTQMERYRQVIGEKECVLQYIGSVQGRQHTQYRKGEVEVTLSLTEIAVHTVTMLRLAIFSPHSKVRGSGH